MSEGELATRLMSLCARISLRTERVDDLPFLADLYASTRETELAQVAWDADTKRRFLHDQFRLQHDHYLKHYLGAELLVVEDGAERIGRIYLRRSNAEIRLMDIALVPERRGQGIGGTLIQALMRIARDEGWEITLHVEPNNPALRLYDRFGFRQIEDRGVYLFLGWPAPGAAAA